MAPITKVIINIERDSDAEAISKTEMVLGKMGKNTDTFPLPIVPLSQMNDDKENLIKKSIAAQHGGVQKTLAKNKARKKVNENYSSNGNYVNSVTKGDMDKALLSGYVLKKPRTKSELSDFELKHIGKPGCILVICRKNPPGLIVKVLQYSYDPEQENSWQRGGYTRNAKKIIKNLVSGNRVWVRVAIIVEEDIEVFCDPISIVVT
jgi:hypothetical protein